MLSSYSGVPNSAMLQERVIPSSVGSLSEADAVPVNSVQILSNNSIAHNVRAYLNSRPPIAAHLALSVVLHRVMMSITSVVVG